MKKIYFEEILSTQLYAKERAILGIKDEIYIAKKQSSGIGRNGHSWFSPEGGLYFSFVTDIYNDIYTLTVGIAIHKALKELYGIESKIKWPNDILVDNKKMAGIICERFDNLVIVGIGVNTNFNANEIENIITIKSLLNFEVNNDILLEKIIENIQKLVYDNKVLTIFEKDMAFIGEKRYISQIGKMATIKGIDEAGFLIVSDECVDYKISGGII